MSRQLTLLLLLAMLICNEKSTLLAQEQSKQEHVQKPNIVSDEDNRIGLSYFEHLLANGQAQECGECLVRIKESFDSVMLYPEKPKLDGAVVKKEHWIRFRFDYGQNRFLFATWIVEDRLELGLVDPVTGKPTRSLNSTNLQGWCFDGIDQRVDDFSIYSNSQQQPFRSRPFSILADSPEDVLENFGPPDFRVLGFSYSYRVPLNLYEKLIRRSETEAGGTLIEVRNSTDSIELRRYFGSSSPSEYGNYVLDSQTLMTTKLQCFMTDPKSGQLATTSDKASFEWKEMDGIFLPAKVSQSGISQEVVRGNDRDFGASEKITDFHWFSINQPFDETAFDGSEIRDEEAIRKLLDPHLSQATSILEKIEKETVTIEPVTSTKSDK